MRATSDKKLLAYALGHIPARGESLNGRHLSLDRSLALHRLI